MIPMIICLFTVFFAISYFAGLWSDAVIAGYGSKSSIFTRMSFGGCTVFVIGMIVCLTGSFLAAPPVACLFVAAAAVAATGIAGAAAVRGKNTGKPMISQLKELSKQDLFLALAVIAVIAFQVFAAMSYCSQDTEVLRGTDTAVFVYERGVLYPSDPMMLFIGCLASAAGLHPLSMIFTVLPAVFITLYCVCYLAVINTVCDKRSGQITAFATVTLLNIWGFQSRDLIPFTMLLKWFSTGSFVIHALLNILAVLLILYMRNRPETANEYDPDGSEEWEMKNHKIINSRNLAIGLAALTVLLIGTVIVLNSKINRLYDATVNLQSDMNKRCAIYEFTPDGGEAEGYLIKGSDGKLSFIGGGGAENAEALGEFLASYGTDIDKWYVYGDDDDNSGAMKQLLDSGSAGAKEVYVINRTKLEGIK